MRPPRRRLGLLIAFVLLMVVVVLSIVLGARPIPPSTAWHALVSPDGSQNAAIVRELRVPRTILGVLVGAAMAVAGNMMQALSRNPLADPGILGVNAGAALAVVVAIAFFGVADLAGYVWFAMLGAALATVLAYFLGSAGRAGASPVRLALAGTAIGAAFSGLISTIVLLDLDAFDGFRTWSVGSLLNRGNDVAWQVLPFMLLGFGIALAMSGPLNALAMGDDAAIAMGANVARIRILGVVAVTLLCGAGTAAVGPIGFVGLVVPHAVRSFVGPDQRVLMPYCLILGPILLLGADIIGRLVLRPQELPVAVVTAFVGAPVFIAIVRRRRLMQL